MARYLSPEWFSSAAAAAAAGDGTDPRLAGVRLTLRQRVVSGPDGDVVYAVRIDDGRVAVAADEPDTFDVTFTQDYATAAALFRGELSAQEAFTAGRIRVSGNVGKLIADQEALAGVGARFDALRPSTTY